MACNPDFIQYIIDPCSDAGEIAVNKMMVFGLICDNNFYVKDGAWPGRSVSLDCAGHAVLHG